MPAMTPRIQKLLDFTFDRRQDALRRDADWAPLLARFVAEGTPAEARAILSKSEGVRVVDDPLNGGYPMPLDATAKYDVLAGRIRQDISRDDKKGLEMFVSGDQLLRGAALNAVEIAEHLIKRGLV